MNMVEDQVIEDVSKGVDDEVLETEVMNDTIMQYNRYHSGEITKDEYSFFIINVLEGYFHMKAQKKRRNISGSYHVDEEDLHNDFVVTVLENIDSYDPYKSHPVRYFDPFVNNKAMSVLGPEVQEYYKNKLNKLHKIAKNHGYKEGLADQELTPDILATLSGESLSVCQTAMELYAKRAMSLEDAVENGLSPSMNTNPESVYIKNEETEYVINLINRFNPFEKFMIDRAILGDDKIRKAIRDEYTKGSDECYIRDDMKWSLKRFKDYFDIPENWKRFEEYLPGSGKADLNFYKRTLNRIMKLLRYNPKLRSHAGIEEASYDDMYEQASFEDIDRAFSLGVFNEPGLAVL